MRAASGAGKLVTLTKAHLSVFPSVACAVAGTSKGPCAAPSASVASRVRCRATHLRARRPVTLPGAGDRGPVGPSRPEPRAQQLCPARPVVIRAALSALRPVSAPTPLSRWDSRAERRALDADAFRATSALCQHLVCGDARFNAVPRVALQGRRGGASPGVRGRPAQPRDGPSPWTPQTLGTPAVDEKPSGLG